MPREGKTGNAENQQDCSADFDTEPAGFFDTGIHLCTKAKAADWLKSLAESDDGRIDEHHKTTDDGHGSDRCVSIGMSHDVHDDSCHTGDSLTSQRRNSTINNILVNIYRWTEVLWKNGNAFFFCITHKKQDTETDYLG